MRIHWNLWSSPFGDQTSSIGRRLKALRNPETHPGRQIQMFAGKFLDRRGPPQCAKNLALVSLENLSSLMLLLYFTYLQRTWCAIPMASWETYHHHHRLLREFIFSSFSARFAEFLWLCAQKAANRINMNNNKKHSVQ